MGKNQSVDQRIVEMQFNNAEFESKVAQTLESLTKLREKSKMEDAGKGMENLAKGVKQVDLQSLAAGIESLNQKFSAFGIMGQQVLRNLTDAAMGLGKQLVDAVTSAPKGGMQTYESFISATKQLKNSAKDAEGLPVTLDAVNKALDSLNNYSDKTIYSFNDMTANIGKFTNAGVSLEDSVVAIQGISNVAASAGASAQNAASAMYNFGQALGTGVVKLIDWKSINNANMGTIEFKNTLIQTAEKLGTLTKVGDKYISTTYSGSKATENAFNASSKFEDSLQQQWMTSEVLIETLRRYASETDDIGKKAYQAATEVNTFGQMMGVFAESQKTAWSKVWRYVFGDYNESKTMWTAILGELNKVSTAFFEKLTGNETGIIKAWHERGGYQDMIEGFKNLYEAAQHFLDPVKDLFAGLFPAVTADTLLTFTRDFRGFAEKLAYPFKQAEEGAEAVKDAVEKIEKPIEDVVEQTEKFKQIRDEIIQGKWGNGQERIDRLTEAGYAFENLQNGVNETLGSTKRYETVMSDAEAVGEKLADNVADQAEKQKNYREEIKKSNDELFIHKGAVENIAYIFLGVSSAVKTVVKFIDLGVNSFKKLSGGVHPVTAALGLMLDVFGNIGRHIYTFNDGILKWLNTFHDLGEAIENAKFRITGFFNTNKDGSKTLGIANDKLGETRQFLLNIVTILQTAKAKITGFFDTINSKIGDSDFLVDLRIALNELGRYVGGAALVAFNGLATAFNKAYEASKALWAQLKNNDVVTRLTKAYKEAKETIQGFFDTLKNQSPADGNGNSSFTKFLEKVTTVVNTLVNVLGKVGIKVFNVLSSGLAKLNEVSQKFFGYLANTGFTEKIVAIWGKFKAVFKELPDIVDKFFASLKSGKIPTLADLSTNLSDFVQKVVELGTELKNKARVTIGNAFDGLVESIANVAKLQLPESLQNLANKFTAAFGAFGDATGTASKTIGDFAKNVIDKIKGIDFKMLLGGGLIGAITLFVGRWSKVGKSSSKALNALTTFLKNGGKAAVDVKEKYNGFLKIGAAIALIAAAVWILAQVPADRFKECAITLGIGFGLMAAAILYLTKAKIEDGRLKEIGLAFAGIGAGVVLLAAAVKAFANLVEDKNFAKGCAAVVIAIIAMVVAIKKTGEVSDGTGAAFAGLAAGVLILAVAVKAFAAMKWSTILKGGVAVVALMFLMAKAMNIAGDVSADGFVGFAASILVLMLAVKSLGGMKTSKLVKGEVAVIALIAAMAIASRSAKDVDGDAFKSMGQAIKILAAAMFILSRIPTMKLLAVTASLVVIFITLTYAMKELKEMDPKDSGKVALALVAMLVPVGAALYLLASLPDPDAVLKVAVGLAAVMWAIGEAGPAIVALSNIDFGAGIKAIALADAFVASLAVVIGGLLAALGYLTENTGFGEAMITGARTLGETIHAFVEGLIFGTTDPSEVLKSIGDALSSFGDKIGEFISALTDMDPNVSANAKNLATAILAICGAELIDAVAGWIKGKSGIDGFSDAIDSIVGSILKVNEAVGGEAGNFDSKAVQAVIKAIKGLTDIANAIPKQGGLLQGIMGHQDLGEFAEQMAKFITGGFMVFVVAVRALGDYIGLDLTAKTMLIANATKQLINLANSLPKTGLSIVSIFTGKQDLGEFAGQMAKFMSGGFTEFVNELNGLPAFDPMVITTTVKPATEKMIELGEELKGKSSIITFITGKSDLSLFGSTLASFGKGIKEFTESIANVKTANVDALTETMGRLAELNASENVLGLGLSTFSETIVTLGHGLMTFVADTKDVTVARMSELTGSLANLHNMMLILAATDYSNVSNFTVALEEIVAVAKMVSETLVDNVIFGIDAKSMDFRTSGTDMANAWAGGFTKDVWIEFFGMAFMNKVIAGIDSKYKEIKESATDKANAFAKGFVDEPWVDFFGMAFMNRILEGIKQKYKDVRSSGGASALEFCVGLTTRYTAMVKEAGRKLVGQAISGINEDISDFESKGNDAAEGFAKGIRDYAYKAAKEAAQMVRDAINAAKEEQKSASPSKVFRGLGSDGAEGYGLGFTDMIDYVTQSVSKTGNAGIYAMRDSIEKMNTMIGDEVDYQPTITPVLDLTQLTNGMQTTKGLLAELNGARTDINAALDIATAHNAALAKAKERANKDYSNDFAQMNKNFAKLIDAARKNKTAVIDGDYLYGYVNTRLGMA